MFDLSATLSSLGGLVLPMPLDQLIGIYAYQGKIKHGNRHSIDKQCIDDADNAAADVDDPQSPNVVHKHRDYYQSSA